MASKTSGNKRKKSTGTRGSSAGSTRNRRSAEREKRETGSSGSSDVIFSAEAAVVFFFALAILLFLSNFGLCGTVGGFLKRLQTGLFGIPGYIFPVFIAAAGIYGIANQDDPRALVKIPAAFFLLIAAGALIHLFSGPGAEKSEGAAELFEAGTGGGVLGGSLCSFLRTSFGTIGAFLVLAVIFILLLVAITERSFVSLVKKGGNKAYRHAREDLSHYREERRARAIRRMEMRRLEEEQQKTNIDLASTDLLSLPPQNAAVQPLQGFPQESPVLPDEDLAETPAPVFREVPEPVCHETPEPAWHEAPEPAAWPDQAAGWEPEPAAEPGAGAAPEWEPEPAYSNAASEKEDDVYAGRRTEVRREIELEDPALLEAFRRADEALARSRRQKPETFPVPALFAETPARPAEPPAETAARSAEPPAVTPVRFTEPPAVTPAAVYEPPAGPPAPAYDPAPAPSAGPSSVSFSDDSDDEYLAFRDHASAETDDGNPYTDDDEPEMPSAEEIAAAKTPPQDPDRTVVTSTGKVIKSEFERTRERMDKARAETEAGQVKAAAEASAAAAEAMPEYRYPPVDLLEKGRVNPLAGSQEEYRQTAMKLQQTLRSFGVDVTVTNISCGPVVTRYELLPAQGVKVSRIVGLADDIKLSLAAADIRIEAPVPGKSVVGIEVPNKENNTVYLRDLFESPQFIESRAKLAFAVGKDIGGQAVVTDIAKMPHLLIAGATGSGKSVCINTLIMSILFRYDPKDVKLIMVDPKVVELSVYNGIPHLLIPVVTDPKKAAGALNWAVAEMTDRYKKFEKTGARNLKGYNEKIMKARADGTVPEEELPALLPQIVIIIDELADLMMVAKGEVEESICRLAQLARAAGLHLVIATQRPSVNVITGLIKANIPSRIAFAVSSGVDSRTILDSYGAEKLLGKGDMLFSPQGAPRPMRVQGAFVSDGDVQKVVDYIRDEGLPLAYSKETVDQMIRGTENTAADTGSSRDELFANAGRFIIDKKKASIGNLQRMFKIGFNRAARIMDQLSEAGVVGEEQGTKPREILMTAEQFEELLRQTQ